MSARDPYDAWMLDAWDRYADATEELIIRYGCHECLSGHDERTADVRECPYCGGLTEPLPAAEQPTLAARAALAALVEPPAGAAEATEETT